MERRRIEIELHGVEESDLELALEETVRLIKEGFTWGGNRNDTGGYSFSVVRTS